MALRTFNDLEQRIRNNWASHSEWANRDAEHGPLPKHRNISLAELKAYGEQGEHFRIVAENFTRDPAYQKLPEDVRADNDEFIAELATHKVEVDDAIHPEKILRRLTPMDIANIMAVVAVPEETKKSLVARAQLKLHRPKNT